jgi:hypothetical protein
MMCCSFYAYYAVRQKSPAYCHHHGVPLFLEEPLSHRSLSRDTMNRSKLTITIMTFWGVKKHTRIGFNIITRNLHVISSLSASHLTHGALYKQLNI